MSNFIGAQYIGNDPIHLPNGNLILNGEVTDFLSEEAAMNDNQFEPVYKKEKKTLSGNNIKKKENTKKSKKEWY